MLWLLISAAAAVFLLRLALNTQRAAQPTQQQLARAGSLALFFVPSPKDPVWRHVTWDNVPDLQRWFLTMAREAQLSRFHMTNDLPDETIDQLCAIANRAVDDGLPYAALLLLLAHQYVDADIMMRQLHSSDWVPWVVQRPVFVPPPESYTDFLRSRYFAEGRQIPTQAAARKS